MILNKCRICGKNLIKEKCSRRCSILQWQLDNPDRVKEVLLKAWKIRKQNINKKWLDRYKDKIESSNLSFTKEQKIFIVKLLASERIYAQRIGYNRATNLRRN